MSTTTELQTEGVPEGRRHAIALTMTALAAVAAALPFAAGAREDDSLVRQPVAAYDHDESVLEAYRPDGAPLECDGPDDHSSMAAFSCDGFDAAIAHVERSNEDPDVTLRRAQRATALTGSLSDAEIERGAHTRMLIDGSAATVLVPLDEESSNKAAFISLSGEGAGDVARATAEHYEEAHR